MTGVTDIRGELQAESSVRLYKSPLTGTYCGGPTTVRMACLATVIEICLLVVKGGSRVGEQGRGRGAAVAEGVRFGEGYPPP